jgi:hypothetical protein
LENWALGEFTKEESHYPTLSYERGIRDALDWLFGRTDKDPSDDSM